MVEVKVTRGYVAAIIDTCGGFYTAKKKYLNFKIRVHSEEYRHMLDMVAKYLEYYFGVEGNCYIIKDGVYQYQVSNRDSVKKLQRFIKKYCLVR